MADRAADHLVHSRHEMRPHLKQEHGQGQRRCESGPAGERTGLAFLARAAILRSAVVGQFGRIARRLGGLQKFDRVGRALDIGDGRGF